MADRQQRDRFLELIHAIEERMAKRPDFTSGDAIAFTLGECKTDFFHGEEGLAYETLIENLYEVGFPITNDIYESLSRLGQELGLAPTKWLVLCKLLDRPATISDGNRKRLIADFVRWCKQPYDDYIVMTNGRAREIANKYFCPFHELTDSTVNACLNVMRTSIKDDSPSRVVADWKGCCVGFSQYLLRPADLDGNDQGACARALQRFSGWYHAGISPWAAFEPSARSIGNRIFEDGYLRYLKIGEEWTFERSRLDESKISKGSMSLWDFALGAPNRIRKEPKMDEETRALSSRLLNFLCAEQYKPRIAKHRYEFVLAQFPGNAGSLPAGQKQRNRHPLLWWSIESKFVDMITQCLTVPAYELLDFLHQRNFNPDTTYNPKAEQRFSWFKSLPVVN